MLNKELVIRDATSSDVEIILELIYLKAEFDSHPESVLATPERIKNDLFGNHPLASVLLAEIKGKPVGFATYHRIYSTFLAKPGIWLDDLYVKAEYRSQQIGQALMFRLCQIAHEIGCGRIDWTVAVTNTSGIQFYKKIGANIFQEVRLCRLDSETIAKHNS
ncbi:MAG TPA: GNAT family N-acetyltransferase [Coleofasciculaceae cyanobacterium]|jgi:GNAT superfamily N-acetyltransferase